MRAVARAREDPNIVRIPKRMRGFPRERVAMCAVVLPCVPRTVSVKRMYRMRMIRFAVIIVLFVFSL